MNIKRTSNPNLKKKSFDKASSFVKSRRDRQDRKDEEFKEQVVEIARVSRTMAGGRRISFRAAVVVGNRKGKVGIGMGKSKEVMNAVAKAVKQAKKHLIKVPIMNNTIPHEITTDYKGARVFLKPAAPGTGIIAGGVIRIVADLSGINNILSKSLGSANKISNLKAMMLALEKLNQSISSENFEKYKEKSHKKLSKK